MSDVSVAFTSPDGEELRFDWSPERIATLGSEAGDSPPWRLHGELDWDEVEAVRLVTARFEDDRALVIAAIRPKGVGGHGEEAITGLLIAGEQVEQLEEVLLSTEGDGSGEPQRIGLELIRDGSQIPLRVGALSRQSSVAEDGGVEHARVLLDARSAGVEGVALYEVLRRA